MANVYQDITWAELNAQVSARLGDSSNVYWSQAEIYLYLAEALHTWSLCTSYWRGYGQFVTSANEPFYDITSLTDSNGNALLSYTVLDTAVVSQIQYELLEPSTGTSWTGSEQFTLDDITQALQRRRDRFLIDTAAVITHTDGIVIGSPPVQRITLDPTIAAIRRLAFVDAVGNVTPLWSIDYNAQRNYGDSFLITAGNPFTFTTVPGTLQEIIFGPPLGIPGTLDLLSVSTGADLNPAAGVLIGIPDDFAWIIKQGAKADLLGKDGPARDPARAAFCERRYRMGVGMAKMQPVVLGAAINGVPTNPDTVSNLDAYRPSWQSDSGFPWFVALFPNLIAIAPAPDGIYNVGLDVVSKAPIPANSSDYVQIGKEYLDLIIDYSCHLAMFKMGGEEFEGSYRAAQNFFDGALDYNERVSAMNPAAVELMKQTKKDEYDRAYQALGGGLGTLQDRLAVTSVNDPRHDGG